MASVTVPNKGLSLGSGDTTPPPLALDLEADCERCCGLCCVAPAFSRSEDFAYTKPAHIACRHLLQENTCAIHSKLVEGGFGGCAVYECSGAGQKVTQVTFGGKAWNELEDPRPMFEAFMAMRTLHELLALLDAALCLDLARPLADRLASELVEVEETTFLGPKALCELDVATIKRRCQRLLREVGSGLSGGGKP